MQPTVGFSICKLFNSESVENVAQFNDFFVLEDPTSVLLTFRLGHYYLKKHFLHVKCKSLFTNKCVESTYDAVQEINSSICTTFWDFNQQVEFRVFEILVASDS